MTEKEVKKYKYTNHRGQVEWLTKLEIEERKERRRKSRSRRDKRNKKRNTIIAVAATGFIIAIAVILFFFGKKQAQYGAIQIASDIKPDYIWVNGKRQDFTEKLEKLSFGNYIISLEKNNIRYSPAQKVINIEAERLFTIDFVANGMSENGKVMVTANHLDFDVYVNGIKQGEKGQLSHTIPLGKHVLSIAKDGYTPVPYSQTVWLTDPGQQNHVQFFLQKTVAVGELEIVTNIAGAHIFLNGIETGFVTPAVLKNIPAGEHTVGVFRSGYSIFSSEESLFLDANKREKLSFYLQRKTGIGQLKVTSSPKGASIILDGENTGLITDASFDQIGFGGHTIKVVRNGYKNSKTRIIEINQEDAYHHVNFVLEPANNGIEIVTIPIKGGIQVDGGFMGAGHIWLDRNSRSYDVRFMPVAGYKTPKALQINSKTAKSPIVIQYEEAGDE
jgi:hypothetical protein